LGVAIPQKSFVENTANKVTKYATTTPMPKLKIAKFEELPTGSGKEAASSNSER
jgi:hypothetical protein